MNKYFILLILICFCFSFPKNKNLRNLDQIITARYASHSNYRYDTSDNKLKFDITLSDATGLTDGETYSFTIAYLTGKVSSSCTFVSPLTLNCEYGTNQPYYGSIQLLPNNGVLSTDDILLHINGVKTLQQTVELTYINGFVEFTDYSNGVYNCNLQIYIQETPADDSFYQLDIQGSSSTLLFNCTYLTEKGYLNCIRPSSAFDLKLLKNQKDGSIKWKNDASYDFEKTLLLKLLINNNIYGYNSKFENDVWSFYVRSNNNINVKEYYYTMNVMIGKSTDVKQKAKALCYMESVYSHLCTVTNSNGITLAQDDFIYLTKDQDDSDITVSFNDAVKEKLAQDKQVSRTVKLKFIKAYGLKYDSGVWNFKIDVEITADSVNIVRNGLNVSLDIYYSVENTTGSCIYNDKILSCVCDYVNQGSSVLFQLDLKRYLTLNHQYIQVGSVTWSNADDFENKIYTIPLDIELEYKTGYNMKYIESKWTWYLKVKSPNVPVPGNSKIIIDILYDTDQKTIAECGKNVKITQNYEGEFTCECSTVDDTKTISINNEKIYGSVTWKNENAPLSINKEIVFKYIKSNVFLNSRKWIIEIEFEDIKSINPTVDDTYETYFGTSYEKMDELIATCKLKNRGSNIFSCTNDLSTTHYFQYILFLKESTKKVDVNTISWVDIPNKYVQIPITTDLTFVKGLINNNEQYIELTINIPEGNALPLNGIVIVDINKDSSPITKDCTVVEKDKVLRCLIDLGSINYSFTNTKSVTSTGRWTNIDTDYKFDLYDTLTYISANNLAFVNNKWQFNLKVSETIPSNMQMIIDILYNDVASTATCNIEESSILCLCDFLGQSKTSLVKINNVKGESSTITWNSLNGAQSIITNAELDVVSVKHLAYTKNKWEFKMNLNNCELPLNSAVKIDLTYNTESKTATCILKIENILTCVPDIETQSLTDTFTINHDKFLGSVTYKSTSDSLIIKETKEITYYKATSLTLDNNNWTFKIKVSSVNKINNNDNVEIDFKFNGQNKKYPCKYIESGNDKNLECSIPKINVDDRIILINNDENQDLVWFNLDNDVELYVSISIEFKNCYGGFYDGKWYFNIKYEGNIETINNYASLVASNDKIAKCKITSKFLLCELNYEGAQENDNINIALTQTAGSTTFTNNFINRSINNPISINIKNYAISNFKYNNEETQFSFKIKGNINSDTETEIGINTLTKISLLINTDTTLDNVVCFTNEINNSPVVLTCGYKMVINTQNDEVYINVDSNGKSNYVTFDGVTDKIKVYKYGDQTIDESILSDNNDDNDDDNGLSTGGIIGIVCGGIAALSIASLIVYYLLRKKPKIDGKNNLEISENEKQKVNQGNEIKSRNEYINENQQQPEVDIYSDKRRSIHN